MENQNILVEQRSNNGWVKAENLKGNIEEYYLDIVVHQGSYDIYLNYVYVDSYSVQTTKAEVWASFCREVLKQGLILRLFINREKLFLLREFTTTNQRLLEVEESLRKLIEEKSALENNYNNSIDELMAVKNKLSEAEGVTDALNIQINNAQSLINLLL